MFSTRPSLKTERLEGWREIYNVNTNQHKFGIAMLISDKAKMRRKKTTKDN
jgi:hypothetical protein